ALSRKLKRCSRPYCITTPVVTSGRRWEYHGVLRTIALMWRLRLAYYCGVAPARLALAYGRVPTSAAQSGGRPWLRADALISRRPREFRAEDLRGMPGPVRIVEKGARQRDHIGLAFGNDRFRLFGIDDHADDANRQAGLATYVLGDRNVESRLILPAALRRNIARGNIDVIDPYFFERLGHLDRVIGSQAAVYPIGAGNARAERDAARHHRAGIAHHL